MDSIYACGDGDGDDSGDPLVEEEMHTCTPAAAEVIYICTHGEVEVEVEMHACTLVAAEAICICTHIEVEGV